MEPVSMKSMVTLMVAILFSITQISAQSLVRGYVKDKITGELLGYCTIGVAGKSKGCISNEEGGFELILDLERDSLRFKYLGYEPSIVAAKDVFRDKIVTLLPARNQMAAVEIFAGKDYLYRILSDCRKELLKAKAIPAKVYFSLDTEMANQPVEMLECYYNGNIQGSQISDLKLKSGRVGLAEQENGSLFVSMNTSDALRMVNLTSGNDLLPQIPLQLSLSKLKKDFELNRINNGDSTLYQIEFKPKKRNVGFEGQVWLDKTSHAIRKIELRQDSCQIHPFEALRKGDSLIYVSMDVLQSFQEFPEGNRLNHTSFSYEIHFLHADAKGHFNSPKKAVFTTGRMYIYDYTKAFRLPVFKYDAVPYSYFGDYHKIANMPYNPSFWEHNTGLLYTERQESILKFLQTQGRLIHFNKAIKSGPTDGFFFEQNNVFWSDTSRIYLRKSMVPSSPDRQRLHAQIFLDINEDEDTIRHFSVTVLDVFTSYFESDNPRQAACFLNIYFDLCEMERRRMEQQIKRSKSAVSQIIEIHQKATRTIQDLTDQYLQKTSYGSNLNELRKWNASVKAVLGIDNFRLQGLE
jgi:hypothetical protein